MVYVSLRAKIMPVVMLSILVAKARAISLTISLFTPMYAWTSTFLNPAIERIS